MSCCAFAFDGRMGLKFFDFKWIVAARCRFRDFLELRVASEKIYFFFFFWIKGRVLFGTKDRRILS